MHFKAFLKENIVMLDGGMGTLLQEQGLGAGEAPERWNLTHPDVITAIHRDYFDAGSHVVCTNTFGANILKFSGEELARIVSAGCDRACDSGDYADHQCGSGQACRRAFGFVYAP